MRKIVVVGAATVCLLGAWVASAGPNDTQPQARAYFKIPFGAEKHAPKEPFHYGLRLDYDSRLTTVDGRELPALANFDFDNRGNRLALVGGVPFAGHLAGPLNQNEGDTASTGGGSGGGGFTFFDWSLLAVGAGGIGFLIYEVSKNKDTPDPPKPATTGTTTGVVTGVVNTVTGVVTGVVNTVTGVVNGVLTGTTGFTGSSRSVEGVLPFDPVDNRDQTYQQWLDGGTGHMGDLKVQTSAK